MNGRLYDPVAGKMLSPDNYIQASEFTQSYNRYSYVFNNPLKYVDPSGMESLFVYGDDNEKNRI
jgi:RHS repeat-associated protein